MAGNSGQWMQTLQRPRKLVNSALNFSRAHVCFQFPPIQTPCFRSDRGNIHSPLAAASCGQIPTQNFNGGSHDLKVQPERGTRSLGSAFVLSRELISPPGHSPCKHKQKGKKATVSKQVSLEIKKEQKRGGYLLIIIISTARHCGASKRFFFFFLKRYQPCALMLHSAPAHTSHSISSEHWSYSKTSCLK